MIPWPAAKVESRFLGGRELQIAMVDGPSRMEKTCTHLPISLETAVGREKAVQGIYVHREF